MLHSSKTSLNCDCIASLLCNQVPRHFGTQGCDEVSRQEHLQVAVLKPVLADDQEGERVRVMLERVGDTPPGLDHGDDIFTPQTLLQSEKLYTHSLHGKQL